MVKEEHLHLFYFVTIYIFSLFHGIILKKQYIRIPTVIAIRQQRALNSPNNYLTDPAKRDDEY